MFKTIVVASAFTLALMSGAYAQSDTGSAPTTNTMVAPVNGASNTSDGSAKSQGNVDTGTTGSVTGNNVTSGGADGDSSSCNATQSGKNTDMGASKAGNSNSKTTHC